MVYIRTKKVKGENYLYLVQSVWDKKKGTSRQEIIKYLGNASDVSPSDIPEDYRDNPKITAFLSSPAGKGVKKREDIIKKLRGNVTNYLIAGNLDGVLKIYETYTRKVGLDDFFENILKPVMYNIGEQWEIGKLSVAQEHVASNIAHDLVKIIGKQKTKGDGKGRVLLCTPVGEEHNLGCNLLESFLQSKGFKIYNLSPSAPSESIIHFIEKEKPDVVFVSITLPENIKGGQRLVKKIKENYNLPIFVGGQALENKNLKFEAKIIDESLNTLPKLILKEIS